MAFTLAFSIGLSVVLLCGAFFICKSDLSTNEKSFSIIMILSLFCLVSIVNEAKKPPIEELKYNLADFHKSFFSGLNEGNLTTEYSLPILEGTRDFVVKSLGGWDFEASGQYQFCLLYSDDKVGKSTSIREYTRELQGHGLPAFYIELRNSDTDIQRFLRELKIANLHTIDETIDRYNGQGKVPSVFIDNIHNAFLSNLEGSQEFPCPVCEHFKALFDKKAVNIVFITNDPIVKDRFRSEESYNNRLNIFNAYQRNFQEVDNYLLEKVNVNIRRDEKKFTSESIRAFLKNFGWNFQILREYITNTDHYENFPSFIERYIKNKSHEIAKVEFYDLIETLLSISRDRNENIWISYGLIKKVYGKDPAEMLKKAIKARIVTRKGNLYRFKNEAIYQASRASQK